MSRDLGRDVPDLEDLYARKLWADFSYPTSHRKILGDSFSLLLHKTYVTRPEPLHENILSGLFI